MQSTVLDNLPETNLSIPAKPKADGSLAVKNKNQTNPSSMQLIAQKNLKENENANNSISACHSEKIVSENCLLPSELGGMTESCASSGADAYPETDASGKTDEEVIESTTFESSGECDSSTHPDTSTVNSMARPASMTSVGSSRTSRESGYFSSSSSNESPQLQLQSTSIESSIDEERIGQDEDHSGNFQKQIESVPEENDEDLKRSMEDLDQNSTNQSNDESLRSEKLVEDQSSNQCASPKENRSNANHCDTQLRNPLPKRHDRVSVKDINKKLGELDHLAPTASMAMDASFQLSYVDRVILELIETERMYVRALEDILAGYDLAIKNTSGLPIKTNDAKKLFGNIKDIYAFNRKFLSYLENCESDPVIVGHLFVCQDASFSVYTEYCTNYPISVSILTRCMKNPVLAHFFKSQQESLRHTLPLGAYLLKPVQRILKYHLILQEMVKNCDQNLENFSVIQQALAKMTFIARHINEMKRKNEDAVHIQELQSLLTNWPGDDLTTYGKIVMEGDLKLQGAKNERLVFLFDRMILISKRREDGFIMYKTHIKCSDLILLESIKENPLSFLIAPFDHPVSTHQHNSRQGNKQYILTVRYPEEKKQWTRNIKKQILINHHTAIPLRAQQSIMNTDELKTGLSTKKNKRAPAKLFGTTLAPSTLDANGKIRRRSESVSRKTLPILSSKKKLDNDAHYDTLEESIQEQNPAAPSKSRFSIPWMNKNSSPKHEPTPPSKSASAVLATSEKVVRDEANEDDTKKENVEQERRFVKKRDKSAMKRNERHKQSVIYKRYKRRQSQPVFTELKRMIKKKDPVNPKPEAQEEKKLNSEVSFDDFESFDDFLRCTENNSRESVSWDVQIVEAVFERFNKEKEIDETVENDSTKEEKSDPASLPTIEKLKDPSDFSEPDDSHKSAEYDSNETLISESIDELTPTEDLTSIDESTCSLASYISPRNSFEEINKEQENEDDELVLSVDVAETPRPDEDALWSEEFFETTSSGLDASEMPDVAAHSAEESNDDGEDDLKDNICEVCHPESPSLTVKRSHLTQPTYIDRRKYFERLKEIRDRRHSNVSLNNYDATQLIQTGTVKEMIAHHRDYVASQVRGTTSCQHSQQAMHEITTAKLENAKSSTDKVTPSHRIHYGKHRSSVTSESSQCEDLSHSSQYKSVEIDPAQNNRFSTLTTGSLPLKFACSSNSSSNSSINDADENHPNYNSPTTPKYKVLLQPRLFLWRSYFEDNGTNARKNQNFATPLTAANAKQLLNSRQQLPNETLTNFPTQKVENISAKESSKDQLSKDVDDDWEDFETKTKKFESLCRSSSSEKVNVKQPFHRSSFRTWKDLAAAASIKDAPVRTSFKQIQEKWKQELQSDANRNRDLKTARLHFASNRVSASEAESSTTPTSRATVKRSSSYQSIATDETKASVATTSRYFNTNASEASSDTISSAKQISSNKSKQTVTHRFAHPQSPVAAFIPRHSSMTNIAVSAAASEDTAQNLSRTGSYKKRKEPVPIPSSSLLRRHSSRTARIKNSSSVDCLATNYTNTNTSSISEKKADFKDKKTKSASSENISAKKEEENFKSPRLVAMKKDCTSEVSEQCSEKSVLRLALRFDHIAVTSGNSNLLTGRNRWNKGRKHHSDLALPTSTETFRMQNDSAKANKQRLKRHQSCVIAKTWQSRDAPLARRFSEAQFPNDENSYSTSIAVSSKCENLGIKHSQFSSTPNSPMVEKSSSSRIRNFNITRAQSEEVFVTSPSTQVFNQQFQNAHNKHVHASDNKASPVFNTSSTFQTINKIEATTPTPPPIKAKTRTRKSTVSESSNSDTNPVSPPPIKNNSQSSVETLSILAPSNESSISSTTNSTNAQNDTTKNEVNEPQPNTLTQSASSKSATRNRTRTRNRKIAVSDNSNASTNTSESRKTDNSRMCKSETLATTISTSNSRSRARGTRNRRKSNPPPIVNIASQTFSVSTESCDCLPQATNETIGEYTSVISGSKKAAHSNSSSNNNIQNVSVPLFLNQRNAKNDNALNKNISHESINNEKSPVSPPQLDTATIGIQDSSELGNNSPSFVESLCRIADTTSNEINGSDSERRFERPPTPIGKVLDMNKNSKTSKNPPSDFIALFCKI